MQCALLDNCRKELKVHLKTLNVGKDLYEPSREC